ncbi:unnamed protein product [Penicillium roqueforti FM164]|uniref:Uncharacterized protein n=1 Tax=Penicillium roqueforti (strain FM164) TaxID=1365484 RepID=W6QTD1_PENRF|nr:unnamed protein product [Penicillium roqueforti FM164]
MDNLIYLVVLYRYLGRAMPQSKPFVPSCYAFLPT